MASFYCPNCSSAFDKEPSGPGDEHVVHGPSRLVLDGVSVERLEKWQRDGTDRRRVCVTAELGFWSVELCQRAPAGDGRDVPGTYFYGQARDLDDAARQALAKAGA
jgi:hypothetical protein